MGSHLPIQGSLDLRAALPADAWFPDETLFSLASRHHIVSCNHLDEHTALQLFGHRSVASRHDLPSHIDVFVEKTHGKLGGAAEVIFERTLLPFYFPLKPTESMENAVDTIRRGGAGSLRYSLGMLHNRFNALHPLKACGLCVSEDIKCFQVGYWHRIHQYPGVWVCPHHNHLLQSSSRQRTRGAYGWCLPREDFLEVPASLAPAGCESKRLALLRQVAFASMAFAALAPNTFLDRARIAGIYQQRLVSIGMRELTGKLRLDDCIDSVLQTAAPLRTVSDLSALPANRDEARAFVSRLCWERVETMHPLRHLFAIVWLFGGWDCFWAIYARDDVRPCDVADSFDWSHCHGQKSAYRRLPGRSKSKKG